MLSNQQWLRGLLQIAHISAAVIERLLLQVFVTRAGLCVRAQTRLAAVPGSKRLFYTCLCSAATQTVPSDYALEDYCFWKSSDQFRTTGRRETATIENMQAVVPAAGCI